MKSFSRSTFRFLSLASVALLMAFSYSCKKDKTEPTTAVSNNPGAGSGPGGGVTNAGLIASASLSFENDVVDFKCYNMPYFEEIIISEDNQLVMMFNSVNQYGEYTGGAGINFFIENSNGFKTGDVYSYDNNSNSQEISLTVTRNDSIGYSGYYGLDELGSGELKITSLNGNKIKGVFNFTLTNAQEPTNKLSISNGKFEGNVFFEK